MPKEYGRERRVADFIQREFASILHREMKDPRVGMVSVNEVKVSTDLGYADLYVSSLDAQSEEEREELLEVLRGAAGFLRTLIAKRAQMRTTPRLRFHWDRLPEESNRIARLIDAAVASDGARRDDSGAADSAADGSSNPEDEDQR